MPTGPDLININELALSDTFNTWFVRTNEIIEKLNPLQVYDVYAGPTGTGLSITGSGPSSGVAVFDINIGPGIGIGPNTSGVYGNNVIIDFKGFGDAGIELTGNPATTDEYIVNDVSDTTLGSQGTPKKIKANKILPPTVDMDGTLTINSSQVNLSDDLYVGGDLIVAGTNSFISSNDLRIEDRQIELAYQVAGYVGITGVTSGVYAALSGQSLGYTAYYANAGGTADFTNAAVIGYTKSFTGPVAGPTAMIKIGSVFIRGTPAEFDVGGFVAFDAPGISGVTFPVVAVSATGSFVVPCPETDFLCDVYLDEAGIVVKAATGSGCGEGDKTFLWYTDDNAWRSNINLGVDSGYAVIASKFVSGNDYISTARDGVFEFQGNAQPTKVQLSQLGATGSWEIKKSYSNISNDANLVFSFSQTAGSSYDTKFTITPGPSGPTYSGVTTTSYAKGFNADQLDGAHGYTGATSYGIPVADGYGLIDPNWVTADSIVKKQTQAGHGFSVGTVVRYDNATNTYQRAYCDYAETAEVIGVVERVEGNDFWINMQGYISGLSLGATGTVYWLAQEGASGGLITNPSALVSTDVRKAVLYSVSLTEAVVLGYPGFKVTDPTDTVYLNNLIPVGSIYPYSGSMNREALRRQGWLVCDGKRYYAKDYNDLWTAIGQTYYGDGTIVSDNGDQLEVTFSGGDPLGLVGGTGPTGEGLRIQYGATSNSSQPDGWFIEPVSGSSILFKGQTASLSGFANGGKVKVRGVDRGLETVFFVPDMRRRVPIGASLGDDLTGSAVPARTRGDVDGIGITAVGGTGDMFTTVNYIIRAKNEYDAVILTGHNHDLRYIRYDAPHNITSGSPNNLTDAQRSQFRQNAKVLSNTGPDMFTGVLSVSGTVRLLGDSGSGHANLSTLDGTTAGLTSEYSRKLYINHYTDAIKEKTYDNSRYGLSVALAGVIPNDQKGGGFVIRGEGYHAASVTATAVDTSLVSKSGTITGPYYDLMILNGHAFDPGYNTQLPGSSRADANSGFLREWPSYGTGHKSLTGNNDTILRNSALKIRGGDHTRTAISLWNDNASDMTASVGGRINFFASQTGASGSALQIPSSAPEFVGGIVAELIPASDGDHTREVSINIGGYSAGAAGILDTKALVVSKEDNSKNLGYKLNSLGTANAQGNYAVQISSTGTLSRSIDPIAMLGKLKVTQRQDPITLTPPSDLPGNEVGSLINIALMSYGDIGGSPPGENSVMLYRYAAPPFAGQQYVQQTGQGGRILLGTGRWIVYGNCQVATQSGDANEVIIGSFMESLQSGINGEWLALDVHRQGGSLTASNVTGDDYTTMREYNVGVRDRRTIFDPRGDPYILALDYTPGNNCSYFGFALKVED